MFGLFPGTAIGLPSEAQVSQYQGGRGATQRRRAISGLTVHGSISSIITLPLAIETLFGKAGLIHAG